jgi:heme-degrading monooxygenase HmoA
MYVQVFEGWRYLPGKREELVAQRSSERQVAGRNTLPDLPGLLARVIGTEPRDPDTGVAFWVWETEDAANAWAWLTDPTLRQQLETYMDVSGATVRGLDGMYFAQR